jgi:hypothetical protein
LLLVQKVLVELPRLLEGSRILFLQEPWRLGVAPADQLLLAQALTLQVQAEMGVVLVAMAPIQLTVVAAGVAVEVQAVTLVKEETLTITEGRDTKAALVEVAALDLLLVAA